MIDWSMIRSNDEWVVVDVLRKSQTWGSFDHEIYVLSSGVSVGTCADNLHGRPTSSVGQPTYILPDGRLSIESTS